MTGQLLCPADSEGCRAEIRASDIGTRAGLFEIQKIGDEFFTFIVDCDKPKACSIILRGASKVCKPVLNQSWLELGCL